MMGVWEEPLWCRRWRGSGVGLWPFVSDASSGPSGCWNDGPAIWGGWDWACIWVSRLCSWCLELGRTHCTASEPRQNKGAEVCAQAGVQH